MKRVVGIDYGDSRIGVAVSDALRITANPRQIIDGKPGLKTVAEEIYGVVTDNDADTIVIGYPINMNGTMGNRVHRTDKFIEYFTAEHPEILIVKWDERLTTKAADKAMIEMGVSQKHKGVSDMIAASMILQGYLESIRGKQ